MSNVAYNDLFWQYNLLQVTYWEHQIQLDFQEPYRQLASYNFPDNQSSGLLLKETENKKNINSKGVLLHLNKYTHACINKTYVG